MTYTAGQFERMERDPVLARCYFWHVAMSARRRARETRRAVRAQAIHSSPVAYDEVAVDARDALRDAETDERLADVILANLDALVASSGSE
jgi:hypothetical protein